MNIIIKARKPISCVYFSTCQDDVYNEAGKWGGVTCIAVPGKVIDY